MPQAEIKTQLAARLAAQEAPGDVSPATGCLFNLMGTSFEPLEDIRRRTQFSPIRLLYTRLHIPAKILPSAQE